MPGPTDYEHLPPLGQAIERLRLDRGLPARKDAANLIGISPATYGKIIHGDPARATANTLIRIANAYEVDHHPLLRAAGYVPNGDDPLARVEHKLDLILTALIQQGAIPDPPDELRQLIADAASDPPRRQRRRAR